MKKTLAVFRYILTIHLTGLLFFMLFRLVLFFVNLNLISEVEDKWYLLFRVVLKGFQFDNFVGAYIAVIPIIVLFIFSMINRLSKDVILFCNIWFIILYAIALGISASDVPYFSYFFSHLGVVALSWFQYTKTTAGMLFQNISYYPYFALFGIVISLFIWLVLSSGKRLMRTVKSDKTNDKFVLRFGLFFLVLALCLVSMRGTFQPNPLRVGMAYFSNNSFFNQLGINPAFYLFKSYEKLRKQQTNVNDLISVDEAFMQVRKELGVTDNNPRSINRAVRQDGEPKNANVVLVLLESMAVNFLDIEHNGRNMTPFLNDLITRSYYFENFYSAGIHTNSGIVCTLYGFPALFNRPMMEADATIYTGIPYNLKKEGYKNLFFLTSNPQYDNMNSFLTENNFDRIYSQYDYPEEKIVNNFGVQDDYLFEYGLERLNEFGKEEDSPFFATFLTISNHDPIIVPERFEKVGADKYQSILAFVDNSIETFMKAAENEEWYDNTIFIFLGDHGSTKGKQPYDMPIGYNHVPCIIYSPLFDDAPKRITNFGGQIDVFPTLMGLLNISFNNNTPGIDLLKENRPSMFFVNDNQLGCIDEEYLYIRDLTTNMDILEKLNGGNGDNIINKETAKATVLKNYAVSMMVVSDFLINNKLTKPVE